MGVSERRQRDKEKMRRRILDAAREIIIAEGMEGLTIRRIADAVEYAPGTLYLYFESRHAIARELCLEVFQAMHDAIAPVARIKNPQKRFCIFVRKYADFAMTDPEMYRLALMSNKTFSDALLREGSIEGEDGPGRKLFALLVKTIAELRDKDTGAFALAEMTWVAIHGLVSLKIACHAYPVTPVDTLADKLAKTLLAGMLQAT
jgi:AcrR family transcriptional regulator